MGRIAGGLEPRAQRSIAMTILEHYINAVRLHLPKDVDKTDVLAELADHLRSKM